MHGRCVAHLYPQGFYWSPAAALLLLLLARPKGLLGALPVGMWFQTWDLFHRHMMTGRTWISRDAT